MNDADSNPEPRSRGVIAWFKDNHVAANILMVFLVIGGLVSALNMRTETFPTIDPRLITVSVAYPGATPYEVADSITSRIEEAVRGIEGVKRVTATASEGRGVVNIELKDFTDPDDIYDEVDTAVNGLSTFPPADAERPIVAKVRPTPNVLTLAIHGAAPEKTLRFWADRLQDDIRQLPGVALTTLRGIRDYQISIEVSEETLRHHGLSLATVADAVAAFSSDVPAGTVESSQGEILLRVQEKRRSGPEFESIAIRTLPDGSVLRLRDVATVVDGLQDSNLTSRFNGERAAFIDVKRSETGDTLKVARSVKDYLKTLSLPAGVSVSVQQDDTVALRDRTSLMLRNGVLGFVLVFLILTLFLDLKLAIWTSSAIPVSFLGGLMVLNFLGYSINMVSLFALIVVLGIVVDDGIVTGESIFDAQERAKGDPNAVIRGVRAVIAPVTVGVTTTMAAFAPLLFSTGTIGQVIKVVPAVVIVILFVSLMEAYFILPSHLARPTRWSRGVMATMRDRVAGGLDAFVVRWVSPFVQRTIRFRYVTFSVFLAITIVTIGMVRGGVVRFIFFPQIEGDRINISLTMPQGTPFAVTERAVGVIEQAVRTVSDDIEAKTGSSAVESVSVSIGSVSVERGGPGGGGESESGSQLAEVRVQLLPSDFRSHTASQIESLIRDRVRGLTGVESLEFQSSLVAGGAAIDVELSHSEESELNAAAERLQRALEGIKGTVNIANSHSGGKTEYLFKLTPEGLAVGLTSQELGRQLRTAFFGQEVQRIQRGDSEVIVYVRYPKAERESLVTLRDARIRLADGREVPLGSVATIEEQVGYSQINTVNGRRVVSVTADVDAAITTPNDVIAILNAKVLPELGDRYPGLRYGYEGATREANQDLSSLLRNMLIAMMLIYVILGAQLRSYLQPVVIMSAIPFGVIGAILGHFLLGYDLTFVSFFGIVALMGVVVNDSVVMLDYMNECRAGGMDMMDSAMAAIRRRFRPIILTTLTTCLGLLPMLLETSAQARFLLPMVVSLATGIVFATTITLVLVPALLLMFEDVKRGGRRLAGRA
ncbi:efflux RND transporter permease subunit [Opitutales bacterium ASA1]|uniref:efflux RND transporter permease subunit n=1 Tax=Congregicoccus parvus TaxID=3081749 RepID=UPI002B2EAA30|nr:efflux RND transporter permease subunit [Opitutales bacterium ASA1]